MSQPHVESGSHRNPSEDAWWRRALDATGAAMQLRAYEKDGQEVTWSDAVMNASAAVSMGWRQNERWADLPKGPLGDLSDGFAQRLAEEYIRPDNVGHWIDNTEFLPNVRAYMARGDVGETLTASATSIVEAADRGAPGEYRRPDPDKIADVRNAMSQRLLEGRYESSPAVGDEDQNFAYRLGYATADAGVKAMNATLEAGNDNDLARSVQHTLGAQPAPRAAAAGERTGGAGARPASAGPAATKQSGTVAGR
ncbi:hypothetical protein OHA18_35755 [Kribbella sp. NBC_00709]|uniref:hypothetical protein n=1 Tax=Kribbella sp. NBC_00709 TaxID=2975972 RepID=UPI002E2C4748|nr:hypothetical protein [Kribbella sp. NBC_00709]